MDWLYLPVDDFVASYTNFFLLFNLALASITHIKNDWEWIVNKWQAFGVPKHNSKHIRSSSFEVTGILSISKNDFKFDFSFGEFDIIWKGKDNDFGDICIKLKKIINKYMKNFIS